MMRCEPDCRDGVDYNRFKSKPEEHGVQLQRRNAAWIGFIVIGLVQPVLSAQTPAQTPASTRDGVYTADQALQGKDLYDQQCSMCHGDTLAGMGQNSPLSGGDFLDKWSDQTLADLFAKIHTTMPATKPGSLSPDETAQVLSFILSSNKFPAGKTALPVDPAVLKTIHIDKPKP
jgi:mono/diheme cytochrome c family protein